ncbi:MAG: peptidase U32 family protein [Planctomycetota bacterium]|jgi:putative protease
MHSENKIQLNAPAGNLPSLIAAVDAGADSVYIGFRSPTNLRHLPGLNFSIEEAAEAVEYARQHGVKVYVTVNTHPMNQQLEECLRAVDDADNVGADAVILADLAVLEYARNKRPSLEIHLSCVAGAADPASIRFYREEFNISCVILPRVLSIEQIAALRRETDVLLEVMVFGALCANYEGRCCLSSFITGTSAYSIGACAPAEFVQYEEIQEGCTTLRLNSIMINDFVGAQGRTYPTPCKGKYYNAAVGCRGHAFQDACCLNALPILPKLAASGVDFVKIEGRQRSLAYVQFITGIWRKAIDALSQREGFDYQAYENMALESVLEGMASTLGALGGG